jgi:hypothetical protein
MMNDELKGWPEMRFARGGNGSRNLSIDNPAPVRNFSFILHP